MHRHTPLLATLPCLLVLAACSRTLPPKSETTASLDAAHALAVTPPAAEPASEGAADDAREPVCEVSCGRAEVVGAVPASPDYTAIELDRANAVLAELRPELMTCYRTRLRQQPDAEAFLNVDIYVGEEGRVVAVDTAGGHMLGPAVGCMVRRIKGAVFTAPHGGGVRRFRVPLTFRRLGPDETT